MSVLPATGIQERPVPLDFDDSRNECRTASLSAHQDTVPPTGAADAQQVVLPFVLIGAGIVIYFVAIAAFASFPGVAIGVSVMVLGGIVYACRGFGKQIDPYPTAPKDTTYMEETFPAFPGEFDVPDNENAPLLEIPEEPHNHTRQSAIHV